MGNQIFQYAQYKKLKSRFPDEEVYCDVTSYRNSKPHNGYELETIFRVSDINKATDKKIYKVTRKYPKLGLPTLCGNDSVRAKAIKRFIKLLTLMRDEYGAIKGKASGLSESGIVISQKYESGYSDDPSDIITNPLENYYVDGTWFNCNYDEVLSELREQLIFRCPVQDDRNSGLLKTIHSTNSVAIHIRRGDYYAWNYLVLDNKYYQDAITYMRNVLISPHFFVFSDEIDIVNREFSLFPSFDHKDFTFVSGNTGASAYIDMLLMSECKHMIIANSTFSVAAELLDKNDNKVVIAPRYWQVDKLTWKHKGWVYM